MSTCKHCWDYSLPSDQVMTRRRPRTTKNNPTRQTFPDYLCTACCEVKCNELINRSQGDPPSLAGQPSQAKLNSNESRHSHLFTFQNILYLFPRLPCLKVTLAYFAQAIPQRDGKDVPVVLQVADQDLQLGIDLLERDDIVKNQLPFNKSCTHVGQVEIRFVDNGRHGVVIGVKVQQQVEVIQTADGLQLQLR